MDKLISVCEKKYSPEQVDLIKRASEFSKAAHEGQKRESGEPYYTHPEAVAISLAKMDMDAETVAAGLLHDTVEDAEGITVEKISELFGEDIAKMVDGVTKLTKTGHTNDVLTREDRQAENLRKMYLAMANDVRVIIIKLADRLHNMRTLGNCSAEKRQRIARETLDVYAPLADRFGMGVIKAELEDLSFEYLYPEEWRHLCTLIEPKQDERMKLLNSAMKTIGDALEKAGIKSEISGRRKHMYSIYRKLKKNNKSLNELYDLVAIRVIVGTVDDCYAALGIIHSLWRPMPGRFKDYISMPKTNMYRSLHTTLFSDLGMPFEVQIRTLEMHRTAEYGVAAHWLYKEGKARPDELDSKLAWVCDLINYEGDSDSTKEYIDSIQKDFFSDYVYVLTPNGEIIDLPAGSTPIDFAYRIHSNVGDHIQHAKVNGALVKLDHKLSTHDVVEIITNQQSAPGRDWINYAKTTHA
ncbi:MAG: bifunctional (p)ppGpp synthetase/guanosine-3',5'-bis(diphosphate) 3'-pyrophosphohydrolase, partial [Clostridia bacterium]|nr:bifunctional (p)ppGpp synthetase/guanosine-3',5'-bis(diphosphate) 3'-pyrophosphohydrolase [Clostridia bacterium]